MVTLDEKVANNMGITVDELDKKFDKKIMVKKLNKKGERLYLYREVKSRFLVGTVYSNKAYYHIINPDGIDVGLIEGTVQNENEANTVEFEYGSREEYRGQGNMSVAVDAALEDVLIGGALNGYPVRNGYYSNIDNVFLSIVTTNKASRGVAKNNGFKVEWDDPKRYNGIFVVTKQDYINRESQGIERED